MTSLQTGPERREPPAFAQLREALSQPDAVISLRGGFVADYRYEGTLAVGQETFNISLDGFNPSFAVQQTVRDLRNLQLPSQLRAYQTEPGRPIAMTINGKTNEIRRADDAGAAFLPILGRCITDNTP